MRSPQQSVITGTAEQTAFYIGLMVMVNGKPSRLSGGGLAYKATPSLFLIQVIVFSAGYAVLHFYLTMVCRCLAGFGMGAATGRAESR